MRSFQIFFFILLMSQQTLLGQPKEQSAMNILLEREYAIAAKNTEEFQRLSLESAHYFAKESLEDYAYLFLKESNGLLDEWKDSSRNMQWYLELGKYACLYGKEKEAVAYLSVAHELREGNSQQSIYRQKKWMGQAYFQAASANLCRLYWTEALEICKSSDLFREELESRILMAQLEVEAERYDLAGYYLKGAVDMALELNDLGAMYKIASIDLEHDAFSVLSPEDLQELLIRSEQMAADDHVLGFWRSVNASSFSIVPPERIKSFEHALMSNRKERRSRTIDLLASWGIEHAKLGLEYQQTNTKMLEEQIGQRRFKWILMIALLAFLSLALYAFTMMNKYRKGSYNSLKRAQQKYNNLLLPVHLQSVEDGAERVKNGKLVMVFVDLSNFKEVSENLNPQHLIELIDDLFSAFEKIGDEYQLDKIKSIGESYLCAGGFVALTNVEVLQAMRAAFAFAKEANRQKMIAGGRGLLGFNVRIGLHVGEVIQAVVGWKKPSFDLWGEEVIKLVKIVRHGNSRYVHASQSVIQYLSSDSEFEFHPIQDETDDSLFEEIYQVRQPEG